MQTCMQSYPTLYNKDLADDEDISSLNQPEDSKDSSKTDLPTEAATESK